MTEMDRPSRHGALLGKALAEIAAVGRDHHRLIPDMCLTCAFRDGSFPNQSPATIAMALNCAVGIDKDDFSCHHGMKDGEPTKLCAGYLAAKAAPFDVVLRILVAADAELATVVDADEVRMAFDAWWATVDPDRTMDIYELSRAYARDHKEARHGDG